MLLLWCCLITFVATKPVGEKSLTVRALEEPPEAGRFFGDEEKNEHETTTLKQPTDESDNKSFEETIKDEFRIEFTLANGSEIVADRGTILEVIPLDYLCDFCNAVIGKLKIRQQVESDFEKNIGEECWAYNGTDKDDGTICELVNKVNLDRLKNDSPNRICVDEKLCPDLEKEEEEKRLREQRIEEEDRRREQERKEDERKKNKLDEAVRIAEAKEELKNEASRLEYEKRLMQENKKLEEERKNRVHSKSGDFEYIVDEVRGSAETNDYLEVSETEKKPSKVELIGDAEGQAADNSPLHENAKEDQSEEEATTVRPKTTTSKENHAQKPRVDGDAVIQSKSPRVIVDRTVMASLTVDDIAK